MFQSINSFINDCNLLTRVEFQAKRCGGAGTQGGGLENDIIATGGLPQGRYFTMSNTDDTTFRDAYVNIDNKAQRVLWNKRYNYRIGLANCYGIQNIKLYRNGTLYESQTMTQYFPNDHALTRYRRIAGVNLDPSNRNSTNQPLGVDYFK